MDIDLAELRRVINIDHELHAREREELLACIDEKDFMKRTAFGGLGAATGLLVAKFLKLSTTTQVLLSLAGFGIGRMLYDGLIKNPHRDNFGKVNPRTNQYEIN